MEDPKLIKEALAWAKTSPSKSGENARKRLEERLRNSQAPMQPSQKENRQPNTIRQK